MNICRSVNSLLKASSSNSSADLPVRMPTSAAIHDQMEKLNAANLDSKNYPYSLIYTEEPEYVLKNTKTRLEDDAARLFSDYSKASVWVVQKDLDDDVFTSEKLTSQDDLERKLRICNRGNKEDPMCRLIFFQAPTARRRLYASKRMFASALTHHQVMPGFVDFVFSFGKQEESEDFHFGAFKTDCRLGKSFAAHKIPELGRSGRLYQICFNLRSVEDGREGPGFFSIRQAAVYHSFDVENGRTTWLVIKANKLIRTRIEEAASSKRSSDVRNFSTTCSSFLASLRTLKILCDWSREGWHGYIQHLEKEYRGSNTSAMLLSLEAKEEDDKVPELLRSNTAFEAPTRRFSLRPIRTGLERLPKRLTGLYLRPNRRSPPVIELESTQSPAPESPSDSGFNFQDFEDLQFLEQKCHEAVLVIKTDVNNMGELMAFYDMLMHHKDFPMTIKTDIADAYSTFQNHIIGIISDLRMQASRLETLIRLLVDRRSFLQSTLDNRHMKLNLILSKKAQESATNTEEMTKRLEKIAIKTEEETIVMRIITVVTLLFLPPTFVSTIMSTDIIRFTPGMTYIPTALKVYGAITIPLTVATIVIAGLFKWYENSKLKRVPKEGKKGGEV